MSLGKKGTLLRKPRYDLKGEVYSGSGFYWRLQTSRLGLQVPSPKGPRTQIIGPQGPNTIDSIVFGP